MNNTQQKTLIHQQKQSSLVSNCLELHNANTQYFSIRNKLGLLKM